VVGGHSQDLARREAAWFDQMSGTGQLAGFYKQLAGFHSSDRRFLVSLGWGTGWTDKTFGSRLLGDERFMERIIDDYRMTRGSRRAGDPFPKSRRAVVAVQKSRDGRIQETPVSPLGWCLVEMKERK
jgi:CRISPR/Cas system CSM-associated protein Csm5 (group 7 of RAMP superfamily)